MSSLEQRPRYRPGLGIDWPRLPFLISAALVLALGAAWMLGRARLAHAYFPLLMPTLSGLVLAVLTARLVAEARCRNRWLAAGVGVTVGFLAYLGSYQFSRGLVHPLARVDLLPKLISLHIRDDIPISF